MGIPWQIVVDPILLSISIVYFFQLMQYKISVFQSSFSLHYLWFRITDLNLDLDPDPAPFVSSFFCSCILQEQKKFFTKFFIAYYLLYVCTSVIKDNKSLRSHKTVEIKFFF
jgi:hypothetical protein